MKINSNNILTTKQIWLRDIEGVSNNLRAWLREDCSERFRYTVATYYGDHCHGIIETGNLGEVLADHEDTGEELEDVALEYVRELHTLHALALENQIDEILLD